LQAIYFLNMIERFLTKKCKTMELWFLFDSFSFWLFVYIKKLTTFWPTISIRLPEKIPNCCNAADRLKCNFCPLNMICISDEGTRVFLSSSSMSSPTVGGVGLYIEISWRSEPFFLLKRVQNLSFIQQKLNSNQKIFSSLSPCWTSSLSMNNCGRDILLFKIKKIEIEWTDDMLEFCVK